MLDLDIAASPKRPTDTLYIMSFILGLILIGWLLMALSVFDMMLRGVAGNAGLGMHVFDGISPAALSDKFDLPYKFSLCVTNNGVWDIADFVKSFLMWGAMVLAMMLPTRLSRSNREPKSVLFTLGYLAVWLIGCGFAVILQWGLDVSGILDAHMVSKSVYFSGAVLILVGVFQLSSFKQKHLAACQDGEGFQRRDSISGWQAGISCMLCCGPLMLVMFVFGLMNVIVMALMTIFMLLERHSGFSNYGVKTSAVALIVLEKNITL